MLSSNDSQERERGLKAAHTINDLSIFLQPDEFGNKLIWEQCATILAEKSDEKLEPYLAGLLEWLQDMNWPGATIILNRLLYFSGKELSSAVVKAVKSAINQNNGFGHIWLDWLSQLLDNKNLKTELPEKILLVLQKYIDDPNWWYDEKTGKIATWSEYKNKS